MKKKAAAVKKDLAKNEDYKRINRIYKACLREYKKAGVLMKEAKARHLEAKKNMAGKEEIKAAACSRKMAKNYKAMWRKLIKVSASHLSEWLKIQERYHGKTEPAKDTSTKAEKGKKKKKSGAKKAAAKDKVKGDQKTAKVSKEATAATKEKKSKTKVKAKAKAKEAGTKAAASSKKTEKKPASPQEPAAPKTSGRQPAAKKPAAKKTVAKKTTTARPRRTTSPKAGKKDNLKRIEGIGVGIEKLFNKAGITTFRELADSSPGKLQGILDQAGPHFKFAKPDSWPEQATLASEGKWEALKAWQLKWKGGVKK